MKTKSTLVILKREVVRDKEVVNIQTDGKLDDQLRLVAYFIMNAVSKNKGVSVAGCLKIIDAYSEILKENFRNGDMKLKGGNNMETNKEHYAKEIIELAVSDNKIMINRRGEPEKCLRNGKGCLICKRYIGIGNVCSLDYLTNWAEEEYHKPIPHLTESEIEELTYYSHHGFTHIYQDAEYGHWFVSKENYPFDDKVVQIYCEYKNIEKDKVYYIDSLLKGQEKR